MRPVQIDGALRRIVALFQSLKIPFHCTGGLAAIHFGEARSTQDVDIVLRIAPGSPMENQFIDSLKNKYLFDESSIRQAIASGRMFQILDEEDYVKIDLYNRELVPGEIDRSVHVEILSGVYGPLASREDAILSKLVWIQKGSHRSRKDVVNMLRNPAPLDWIGLRERAAKLELTELLETLYERSLQTPRGDELDL